MPDLAAAASAPARILSQNVSPGVSWVTIWIVNDGAARCAPPEPRFAGASVCAPPVLLQADTASTKAAVTVMPSDFL